MKKNILISLIFSLSPFTSYGHTTQTSYTKQPSLQACLSRANHASNYTKERGESRGTCFQKLSHTVSLTQCLEYAEHSPLSFHSTHRTICFEGLASEVSLLNCLYHAKQPSAHEKEGSHRVTHETICLEEARH